MTAARSTKIDLSQTPFYHCMSRCVRRTYLCGVDKETGRDFSHRRYWIIDRIKQLANIFAIQICAFAVMSNHYHLILFIDEAELKKWDDDEVKARWAALCPNKVNEFESLNLSSDIQKETLGEWRRRLADVSWYMKSLNERIARLSNQEDDCLGHFWESRFKSQALLDEGALLTAMAYVDLNPIRANEALTPETSEFTSIFERIKALKNAQTQNESTQQTPIECDSAPQPQNLMPFANGIQCDDTSKPTIDFRFSDYLQLVDTTGRIIREDKPGAIPESLSPILHRLNLSPKGWMEMVKNLERNFFIAIGHESVLVEFRANHRTQGPRGLRAAKQCYLSAA